MVERRVPVKRRASERDAAFKLDRTFQPDMIIFPPVYEEIAAIHGGMTLPVQKALAVSGDNGRRRAGSTGFGESGATLPDTETDMRPVEDLHKAGIDPFRKERIVFRH